MKKLYTSLLILFLGVFLVSCENSENSEITLPSEDNQIEVRDKYDNKFGEDLIPDQWENYGIGDPYVMRYNGLYYLYASTKDGERGIKAWTSTDLVNWSQVETEGLTKGFVTEHDISVTAYAPEVLYLDGKFILVTSPGGNGHFLLESDSPAGPFEPITGNIGESIDGSFFMDDNEQLYFLRSSNSGIRIIEMNDDLTFGDSKTLDNTIIGNWTEGPFITKRDGIYYLQFTGNHVTSPAYRVGYSFSEGTTFDRGSYTYGDNILLDTSEDFNGLGHNSSVIGPNLDSHYIAYHNLNSSGGPNRSFNLGRLLFNGTSMMVNDPNLEGNFVPELPEFSVAGKDLEDKTGFVLSNKVADKTFTAEFNYVGNNVKTVFDYKDDKNYSFVNVNNKDIKVVSVSNGKETVVAEEKLNKTYDFSKLHTIRVSHRDGKLDVYFDNMRKIVDAEYTANGGKIGFVKDDNITYEHTTFSNVSKGLSDEQELKREIVYSNLFDRETSSISKNTNLVRQNGEQEGFNGRVGSNDLSLAKGDKASYRIYVEETANYTITMTLPKSYAGREIGIQVDNATGYKVVVPNVETDAHYVKVVLNEMKLPKGSHYLSIHNLSDSEITYSEISFFESNETAPQFEHDLSSYVMKGATYINSWKLGSGGHRSLDSNRQLVYFGNDKFTDFTISADITFEGDTNVSTAGFILRAGNASFSVHDSNDSIQGYYIAMNNHKVTISKYNHNLSDYDVVTVVGNYASNTTHNLKAVVRGNTITVFLNDVQILELVDPIPFSKGRVGLYTEGATAVYKNLKISK